MEQDLIQLHIPIKSFRNCYCDTKNQIRPNDGIVHLFTVIFDDANLPIDDIWACLTNTKTKPNLSTMQRSATEPDSLYELEKGTQDIVSTIMQRVQDGGGTVKIPGVDKVFNASIVI